MDVVELPLEKVILVLTELLKFDVKGTVQVDGDDLVLRFNSLKTSDVQVEE